MLPPCAENARQLCHERFKELSALGADLLTHQLPEPVKKGCGHLQQLAERF
jgi:hypothetical protein